MLTHLTLINFALADHLALDIDQGFNLRIEFLHY